METRLSQRYVKIVVCKLNKILDNYCIYGKEHNKQVIKQLIIENLSKNAALELIKELEETPIKDWQD